MPKRNEFDISGFKNRLESRMKVIPRKMGMLALDHFDKSFRNQGFTDTTLQPWKKTKSGKQNKFGKQSQGILIGRGRLRRGTRRARLTNNMVQIVNSVPYAPAHNKGFSGNVAVPAHTRRQTFKYKYKHRTKQVTKEVQVKAHTRRMNMPRRRFMGNSHALNAEIRHMIIREINNL